MLVCNQLKVFNLWCKKMIEVIKCSHTAIVDIDSLVPNPKNRNKHSTKQIEVLAKIIKQNGQRSPIVVSNRSGFLVKGHSRLEALRLLGWNKAAVDFQDYASEADEYRDMIADNTISSYAEFDRDGFLDDVKELDDINFEDFGLIDFKIPELLEPEDYGDKNSEIDTENFGNDLQHICPKCSFEFND